ncbi:MAG: hypothetical protein FWD09_08795 [Lentimicrobiaceae bacterium]|nr:hypothetical protein [Lentimicrobiaceae bacterium]
MKKLTFLTILAALAVVFSIGKLSAQVNVGADVAPHSFSMLEVQGQNQADGSYGGLRLPQLTTTQRDGLKSSLNVPEAKGLMIFNTTINCVEVWNGTAWKSLCEGGTGGGTDPGTGGDPSTWNGIECGAYIASGVWKKFMCRNLGADPNAHPITPSADLNGDYYNWGSHTPAATWNTIINPTPWNIPTGWYGNNTTATDAKVKSFYDPCPAGYRIPTNDEWQGVFDNNTRTNIPTPPWSSGVDNWAGTMFGDKLFLPAAGYRGDSGGLINRGTDGAYWGTRMNDAMHAYNATFVSSITGMLVIPRTYGQSIRCISID